MKHILAITAVFTLAIAPLLAKDAVPRGYMPIAELEQARIKADGKKLIVVVVKGMEDGCPNCAEAFANGESAIGSGVVKVFARAENMNNADTGSYPAALKQRVEQQFTTGASVCFLVFDPAMEKLIVEASRSELQNKKKLAAGFKKTVQTAKQQYK